MYIGYIGFLLLYEKSNFYIYGACEIVSHFIYL